MVDTNTSGLAATIHHPKARTTENDVEVHTVDTNTGIVFNAQIDVLLNSETEVSVVGEAVVSQFVFPDLQ